MTTFSVKKSDNKKQIVYGEVYAPNIPDADGDIMSADQIEQMAYKFMRERKTDQIDIQHDNKVINAYMVESFIVRKGDPDFPIPGAWAIGVHIPDRGVWERIEKGELNGFSMEAMVTRHPEFIEIELPPVIQGMVTKADDGHDHEFFVSYDGEGNFQGGRTSTINGHFHVIKRGTITEPANGHHHRYSYVEKLL